MPESEVHSVYAAVISALEAEPGVSVGQRGKKGFGSSALQVNGKIFAFVSPGGSLVLKLPLKRVDELVARGAGQRFDPGHGRLMKQWLSLAQVVEDECLALAREALQYVGKEK
jgi:hypothetical protein